MLAKNKMIETYSYHMSYYYCFGFFWAAFNGNQMIGSSFSCWIWVETVFFSNYASLQLAGNAQPSLGSGQNYASLCRAFGYVSFYSMGCKKKIYILESLCSYSFDYVSSSL